MRIGHMMNSMMYTRNMSIQRKQLEKSMERLSTGKRINHGADSPSDMLKISRHESQIRGSQKAQKNIQEGLSLIQVADNALDRVEDIGLRLKELSTEYQSETISQKDKKLIEKEARQLVKEINHIFNNTKFNGIRIFKKDKFRIQTGPNQGDFLDIRMKDFDMSNLNSFIDKINNIVNNLRNQFESNNIGFNNEASNTEINNTNNIETINNTETSTSDNAEMNNSQFNNEINNVETDNKTGNVESNNGTNNTINNTADNTVNNTVNNTVDNTTNNTTNNQDNTNSNLESNNTDNISDSNTQNDQNINNTQNKTNSLNNSEENVATDNNETDNLDNLTSVNSDNFKQNNNINNESDNKTNKQENKENKKLEKRLNRMENKLNKMQNRLNKINQNIDTIRDKLENKWNNDTQENDVNSDIKNHIKNLNRLAENNFSNLNNMQNKIDKLLDKINKVQNDLNKADNLTNTFNKKENVKYGKGNKNSKEIQENKYNKRKQNDLDKIKDLLKNTKKIDKEILEPVARFRNYLGVQERILESRLRFQQTYETINADALSKIQDTDIAREIVNITKNQMLMNINATLLSQYFQFNKSIIINLLN